MCCMDVCLDKNIMEAVWDLQRQKLRVCPRTASGSPSRSSGHERPASYPKISVSGKANQSVWFWSDITSSQRNQQAANKYINSSLWKLCFVLNVVRDGVGMFEQWLHERTLPPSGLGLWLKGMGFAWTFFFFLFGHCSVGATSWTLNMSWVTMFFKKEKKRKVYY